MTGTAEFFGRRATIARASRLVAGAALGLVVGTALLAGGSDGAMALAPQPDPLPQPVTITIGVGKAAHLSPLGALSGRLQEMNVDLNIFDFIRYADARTAIARSDEHTSELKSLIRISSPV